MVLPSLSFQFVMLRLYNNYSLIRRWTAESLSEFLASAVDAAQKAGDVSSFSLQFSSFPSSLHLSISILYSIFLLQVIRKGFYQIKHVEHKGSVCYNPLLHYFLPSYNANVIFGKSYLFFLFCFQFSYILFIAIGVDFT